MAKHRCNLVQHLAKHQEIERYDANRLSKLELMPTVFPNATYDQNPMDGLLCHADNIHYRVCWRPRKGLTRFGTSLFDLG